MEPILRSSRWLADLQNEKKLGPERLELLAVLCPRSLRGQLRTLMAPLEASLTLTASPLLDILDSLEEVGQHE